MPRIRPPLVPLVLVLAAGPLGCTVPPPDAEPPDVAPAEDGPTLRPSPTPPGRQGDVPGPPVVKP